MDHVSFSLALQDGLREAESRGIKVVSTEDVKAHIGRVATAISEQEVGGPKAADETGSATGLSVEAYENQDHEWKLKLFDSTINAGQNATRIILAINGGAAVAVLTFIGHLTAEQPERVAGFAAPLMYFTIGVALTASAAAFIYFSQACYTSYSYGKGEGWNRAGKITQVIAIAFGLGSVALFVLGLSQMRALFLAFGAS